MSKTIKTKNKFKTVFYMSYGLSIQSITFQKEKDNYVPVFEIKGENLEKISFRYRLGIDIIIIAEFESNLKKLEKLIKNEYELFLEDKKNEGK